MSVVIQFAKTAALTAINAAVALKAPLASPALTGTPTAPTPISSDNSTKLATTAYVTAACAAVSGGGGGSVGPDLTAIEALTPANDDVLQRKAGAWTNRTLAQLKLDLTVASDLALKANLASPTFTGTPAAPTATAGTNTTQIATTAFVTAAVAAGGGGGGGGTWGSITGTLSAQTDLNTALGLKAALASPTFTGTPAAPTASTGTSTTQIATTAFVAAAIAATPPGSGAAWGAITGTLSSQTDLNTALGLKATIASPTFTGTPAAPTASAGTNTTQIATTAFVTNAVASVSAGSATETVSVTQTAHSFTAGQPIYRTTGGAYALARANAATTSNVIGIVESVTDANNFIYRNCGVTSTLSAKTDGTTYYLDDATAGAVTAIAPTTAGSFVVELYKTRSSSSAVVNISMIVQVSTASVSNTELATMPANTVKANITGSTAAPTDVTKTAFNAWLATTGSGLTNPMTSTGDLIIGGSSGSALRLGIGTTGQVLTVVSGTAAWAAATGGGGGFTNPMTTTGDIIVATSGGTAARLGIGSTNQVLTVISGTPTWAAASSGFSNPMTTAGDIIIATSGGTPTRLAIGSSAQVLTVVSGAPAWAAASGGSGGGTLSKARFVAAEGVPPVTNGAVPDLRGSVPIFAHGDAATGAVDFFEIMPEGYNGSNLTVRLKTTAVPITGDVRWEAVFENLNTDIDAESLGTVKQVTDTVNGTSGIANTVTFTFTQSEADGIAAGDFFRLRISRLGADVLDTAVGNAETLSVEVRSAS